MTREEQHNKHKQTILNAISYHTKNDPVDVRGLMWRTGLKRRQITLLIAELRLEYPITADLTRPSGGGYWLARDPEELNTYIRIMKARRDAYNITIKVMEDHLNNGDL